MNGLLDKLNRLLPFDLLPLLIGLLLGLALVIVLRARQVWRQRRSLGYSPERAYGARARLTRLALFVSVVALATGGVILWRAIRPADRAPAEQVDEEQAPRNPLEGMKLVIPSLGIETEVIEAPFAGPQWDISNLTDEAAHLAGTEIPGEPGNAVLAGHVTIPNGGWGPFREIESLQEGALVFIEQGSSTYTYEVREVFRVEPTDVEVAFPTTDTRLTLITCTGWSLLLDDYAQRIVVVAYPVESTQ